MAQVEAIPIDEPMPSINNDGINAKLIEQAQPNYEAILTKFEQYARIINDNYQPPLPTYQGFVQIKNYINNELTLICEQYDVLVTKTGNMKSKYFNEKVDCYNVKHSQLSFMFALRDNDFQRIKHEQNRMNNIHLRLVASIETFRQSSKYKTQVNKYLTGS